MRTHGHDEGNFHQARDGRGFTLIELLVVISIVVMLVGILMPALGKARQAARNTHCLSNLRQVGLASVMYLDANRDWFWKYGESNVTLEGQTGTRWWFGFTTALSGTLRPLDTRHHVLAAFASTGAEHFQCPDFPFTDERYNPKFDQRAATYGYNLKLARGFLNVTPARRVEIASHGEDQVVLFADGVQFDTTPSSTAKFNEGHYLSPTAGHYGYAHYRHQKRAHVSFVDGHVAMQQAPETPVTEAGGHPVANLASPDGSLAIYGP